MKRSDVPGIPLGALAPLGRALLDHHRGEPGVVLRVRFDTGQDDLLAAADFFRLPTAMEPVDAAALERARARARAGGHGRGEGADAGILDVGAGAGALTLPLQEAGLPVTALEGLPDAATVLRARGAADVREEDLWSFEPERPFHTVLALMNGSGLAGTLGRLAPLLERLATFMTADGILLLDSVDLREVGEPAILPDGRYVGELQMQLTYAGLAGDPFPHLFVDPDLLAERAAEVGLATGIVARQEDGRFLAELTRTP